MPEQDASQSQEPALKVGQIRVSYLESNDVIVSVAGISPGGKIQEGAKPPSRSLRSTRRPEGRKPFRARARDSDTLEPMKAMMRQSLKGA